MRHFILSFIFSSLMLCCKAQKENPGFNSHLADSLGADDYGMKTYVLVMLKTGPEKAEKKVSDSLFNGHMQNMKKMAEAGQLVVAGPLKKNDQAYRGIFILNVTTIEAAAELLKTDPAVAHQLLSADLYIWYGSAALPMYLPFHKEVQRQQF